MKFFVKKMICVVVAIILVLGTTSVMVSASNGIIDQNFESYNVGDHADGWYGNASHSAVKQEENGNKYYGYLSETYNNYAPTEQIGGKVIAQVRVLSTEWKSWQRVLAFEPANGSEYKFVQFTPNDNGRLYVNNGSTEITSVRGLNKNKWNTVTAIIDLTGKSYDAYLNGTKLNESAISFSNATFDKIKKMDVRVDSDDILVYNYEDGKPHIFAQRVTGTTVLGQPLTAEYNYIEANGVAEGTTTYQWYRKATASSEPVAISGANQKSYTTTGDDFGAYLCCEITPVTTAGTAGPTLATPLSGKIEQYVYNEDFESYSDGDTASWTNGSVASETDGNSYFDAPGNAVPTYTLPYAMTGTVVFEADFNYMTDKTTLGKSVLRAPAFYNNAGKEFGRVAVLYDGTIYKIRESLSGGDVVLNTIEPDSWNHFKIVIDTTYKTFDIFVNDEPLVLKGKIDSDNATDIKKIEIRMPVDNIKVYNALSEKPVAYNAKIDGTPVVGQELSAAYTYYDMNSDAEAGTTYQWLRSENKYGEYTVINGATSKEYEVKTEDVGKYIKVQVTPKNATEPTTGDMVETQPVAVSEYILSEVEIAVNGENDAALASGDVKASVTLTNNMTTPLTGQVIVALYKDSGELVKVGVGDLGEELSQGEKCELEATMTVSEEELEGNTYLRVFVWESLTTLRPLLKMNEKPLKVLFIGNSYTTHGPSVNAGWLGDWGMAASSADKDYAHLLTKMIMDDNKNIEVKIKNISRIEKDFTQNSIDTNAAQYYQDAVDFDADVIIATFGANIKDASWEDDDGYTNTVEFTKADYKNIIDKFNPGSNAVVIAGDTIQSGTTLNDNKKTAIKGASDDNGYIYVELDDIITTFPVSIDYAANPSLYANALTSNATDSVLRHPGDTGMRYLANRLYVRGIIEAFKKLGMDYSNITELEMPAN